MAITFEVSKVELAKEPLPTVPIVEAVAQHCGRVEAAQTNVGWLVDTGIHPFLGAVHCAFASHYPLVLSPDDIWLCIAQGFATHVELNAEALRDRFVRHQGKKALTVRRDGFRRGDPSNDWPGVFAELSDQIAN